MQSILLRRLFHRKLSQQIEAFFAASVSKPESLALEPQYQDDDPHPSLHCPVRPRMPKTIRELLSDTRSTDPRFVRLHNSNYSPRDLLGEILSMASRIVRRVSEAQMSSTDRRWWPIREIASKWDSIRAYPEMLQGADVELLKILVLDAYADMERLGSS
ncbi:hypothetical protein AC578_904 [Pseudocercospora eumusae]|uniref:Uncharacterized protein n=1 Tax=Pseudocercospora eumusae TaxID=321146 RepID=A0A139HBX4_9PEZI|nr:hypothetical protein AC578_904 [Pseudocercospora eumusae]